LKKTTLVVGAGASADFNLPLGSELAEQIRVALNAEFAPDGRRDGLIIQSLGGYSDAETRGAQDLRGALLRSPTIDHALFTLRGRPAVVRVGKVAVAQLILRAEEASPLPTGDTNDRHAYHGSLRACQDAWIAHLLKALLGDRAPDELDGVFDNVAFVIFNYDRCVQQYLYYALRDMCALERDDAAKFVGNIQIAHVYGSLGRLDRQAKSSPVEFGSSVPLAAGYAAQSLRTYTEGAEDGAQTEVRRLIGWAERVVFLGFGFDALNMKVLYPDGPIAGQELWGTCFGIEAGDERLVSFSDKMIGNAAAAPSLLNWRSAEFIKHHAKRIVG
jgi:hypothetical protein